MLERVDAVVVPAARTLGRAPAPPSTWLGRRARALRVAGTIAVLGVAPVMLFATMLWLEGHRNLVAVDFKLQVAPAVHDVLHGASPYPKASALRVNSDAFIYPAPTAIAGLPFGAFTDAVASWLWTAFLIALVPVTLYVLRIRDWRCYGAALLWAPVASAVQTGNLTLPLALCAALAWRCRDSRAGVPVALATAVKLFMWPLVLWLAATRRWRQTLVAIVLAAVVLLASWAAIGFAGLVDYPALVRRLNTLQAPHSYTLYALGLELGAPALLAKIVWLAAGLGALAGCVMVGRAGNDRGSFVLAIVASLALSPIVWLHYFALLLVPFAINRARFGLVWLLPIVLWVVPADGNGRAAWQTGLALAVVAAMSALSLAPDLGRLRLRVASSTPA